MSEGRGNQGIGMTSARTRDRLVQRLVDTFRTVATALGLKIHQFGVDRIQILRQIDHAGDIGVPPVAIGHQAEVHLAQQVGLAKRIENRLHRLPGAINVRLH